MSDINDLLGKRLSLVPKPSSQSLNPESSSQSPNIEVPKTSEQLFEEALVLYNNKQYEESANLIMFGIEPSQHALKSSLHGQWYELLIQCTTDNDQYDEHYKVSLLVDYYKKAGNAFHTNQDLLKSILYYTKSLELYQNNKFLSPITNLNPIPNIAKQIGGLYTLLKDYNNALTYYKLAASSRMLYKPDGTSSIDQDLLKIADTLVMLDDYDNAIPIYEQVSESHKTNMLLKWSTKVHYVKASLCRLLTTTKDKLPDSVNIITNYFMDEYNKNSAEAIFIKKVVNILSDSSTHHKFNLVTRYNEACTDLYIENDDIRKKLVSALGHRFYVL